MRRSGTFMEDLLERTVEMEVELGVEAEIFILTSSASCVLTVEQEWAARGITVFRLCQSYQSVPQLEHYFR